MASTTEASGSTLRRCLARWTQTRLLAKVHALLVGMLRGHPDLILDSCSVRAKRGGELTGPNPTDRGKFERLFLAAFAVMARIRRTFADKGYDAEPNRDLCRQFRVKPRIHKRRQPRGSGLSKRRWPVERSNAWLLENKRLGLRYDRLGFVIQALFQAACIFLVAPKLAREF